MPDLLAGVTTEYLGLDGYVEDFYRVSADLDGPIWKSERAQTFSESGNPSWEAFAEGRWDEAVDLAGAGSAELKGYFADLDTRGCSFHRVRVVELPPTPYLRWETHVIRTRALAGERVRVVITQLLASVESRYGRLPELVILGTRAGHLVDYSVDGVATGAHRFTDRQAMDRCVRLLTDLYARGEDLVAFFDREIAPLGPSRDRPRGYA